MLEEILSLIENALREAWERATRGAQGALDFLLSSLREVFDRLGRELGRVFASIWYWIDENIARPIQYAFDRLKERLERVADVYATIFSMLWSKIQDGAAWLWQAIQNAWEALKSGAAWLADQIGSALNALYEGVKGGLQWIGERIGEGLKAVWSGMESGFKHFVGMVTSGLENVGRAFAEFGETVRRKLTEGFNIVVNIVKDAFDRVAGWVREALDSVARWLGRVAETLENSFRWLLEKLKEVGSAIWDALTKIKDGIEWLGKKLVALGKVLYLSFQLAVIWIAFTFGTPPDIALGYMYGLAVEASRAGAEGLAQFYAEWKRQWEGIREEFKTIMAELKKAFEELLSA